MPVTRNPEAKLGKPITFRMTPDLERQIDAFMKAKEFVLSVIRTLAA